MNCPHCEKEITLNLTAHIPPRQRLQIKLTMERPMLSARTLGETITNTEKLLKAVAKDIGGSVHVFVDRVEWADLEVTLHFVIVDVKQKTAPK